MPNGAAAGPQPSLRTTLTCSGIIAAMGFAVGAGFWGAKVLTVVESIQTDVSEIKTHNGSTDQRLLELELWKARVQPYLESRVNGDT